MPCVCQHKDYLHLLVNRSCDCRSCWMAPWGLRCTHVRAHGMYVESTAQCVHARAVYEYEYLHVHEKAHTSVSMSIV